MPPHVFKAFADEQNALSNNLLSVVARHLTLLHPTAQHLTSPQLTSPQLISPHLLCMQRTGLLGREELKFGLLLAGIELSPAQFYHLWVAADKDNSGGIDFSEFLEFMVSQ